MSDVIWQALIAAFLTIYLEWSRRKAEDAVKEVKTTLSTENKIQTQKLDNVVAEVKKIDNIEAKIEEVHLATNSMKDQLVAATEKEALERGHAAGIKQEQDRPK